MNSVVVRKDKSGQFCGFTSIGHADLDIRGYDIVCAGISTLILTAAMALEQFTTLKPKVKQNTKKALIDCNWINDPTQVEKSDLIIKTMLLGLSQIQKQYPKHLSIQEVEV